MTDEQIDELKDLLRSDTFCVGWDGPARLRRILAIETRDGEPAGVLSDGRFISLYDTDPVSIIVYRRPFAIL